MAIRTIRQTQIIEESLVLIAEHGMGGLTYRNLSERFGISIPAFYRHFPSKVDVLLGIIDYLNDVSIEVFRSAEESGANALDRLRLVLMGYAEQFSKNRGLAAVLFPDVIGEGTRELQKIVLEHMRDNRSRLTTLLVTGIADGLVRADVPADRWASMVMASLRLEVTEWRLDEKTTDLVEQVAALWKDLEMILTSSEIRQNQA